MKSRDTSRNLIDLAVVIFIFFAGLFAAWVAFGVLESTAEGEFQQYRVGGAIAGFLAATTLLATFYLQVRKSSGEFEELRERADELEHKLLRGGPCPRGFQIEAVDRQQIVFARPREWTAAGGLIVNLEMPKSDTDDLPGIFRCYFVPITDETPGREDYFLSEIAKAENAPQYVDSFTSERLTLGGDQSPIDAIKIIARQYARIHRRRSPVTGQMNVEWTEIPKDSFFGHVSAVNPAFVLDGSEIDYIEILVSGWGFRKGATVQATPTLGEKSDLETTFINDYTLYAKLTPDSWSLDDELRISVQNPDTGGECSNTGSIRIVDSNTAASLAEGGTEVGGVSEPESSVSDAEGLPGESGSLEQKLLSTVSDESMDAQSEEELIFRPICREVVTCYHDELGMVYVLELVDDDKDFSATSAQFNQILASVRFLV
ncbi:MAG: hypothetical protein QNI99_10490 [Woeseiaceae bacterium]|nr:hypothetical protein [Woeseiaceae bacterium]